MQTKNEVVGAILQNAKNERREQGTAFAPSNIALCKYWGKRDAELNLPVTSSLSISLGRLGTQSLLKRAEKKDRYVLNGQALDEAGPVAGRIRAFFDLFRSSPDTAFELIAENTIPTAAGLASSASGFAALVLALNDLNGWGLGKRQLSILARLGSGSAARSIFRGFVEWHAGRAPDGMDSFAEPLPTEWPEFRLGLLLLSCKEKKVGSRPAMIQTTKTSALYASWPAKVAADLEAIKAALNTRDFKKLGEAAESNALTMHATMIAAQPPILYWLPESVAAMQKIWDLRQAGLDLYFTMDAGPNIKLLFLADREADVRSAFPDVKIVAPFQA